MTTYTKPAVRNAWAQNAGGSDLVDPGDTFTKAGWVIGAKPPRQYFNWVLNYNFAGIRYLCQQGIAAWDANETYPIGAITLNGFDGAIYRCINASGQGQRPDGSFGISWDIPLVNTAQANDSSGRIANTAWVRGYALPVGSPFNALSGSIFASQVPVGAVTQWQGSLSISGGQVSSAVARANTLLINGYATFNWAGQSGQPSWLFGSNDGTNIFVWNPSNFSVNNSNLLNGLAPNISNVGNTIVARDASGYIYAGYFNQVSPNGENPSISQIVVTNGGDNYFRKASLGALVNALVASGLLTSASFPGSGTLNGYQKFPNGIIIQWGFVSGPGTNPTQVSTSFPIAFPNQCFATFCNTFRTTGGAQGANFVAAFNRTGATYVFDNMASPSNTCGGYFFAVGN